MIRGFDTELMTDEFMHNFGDCCNGVLGAVSAMAASTGDADALPDRVYGRPWAAEYAKKSQLSLERFNIYLNHLIGATQSLTNLVDEQDSERPEHSKPFQLVKAFCDLLKLSAGHLKEYRDRELDNYQESFQLYTPYLRVTASAVGGLMVLRELYDETVDATEARRRWVKKHPEFS